MKITLIFPGIAGMGFDCFNNTALGLESYMIHHGLCSLSACLKQAGHRVDLIDLRKLKGWRMFREAVRACESRVMGITMMSLDFENAVKACKIIKQVRPETTIVAGGIHATVMTEQVKAVPEFDYIVRGEGEITFCELLERIERGDRAERVLEGKHPDLDELPFVDRELFDSSGELNRPFYAEHFDFKPPFVTMIAGRGCLYNCSFCQPAEREVFGTKVRRRSVDNVMAELEMLRERYGFRSLMIHDDCMLEDKQWVLEFCRRYSAQGFDQPFFCQGRADIVCKNEDMMAVLAETGLRALSIGFESGSQRVLNILRKGVKIEYNYKASEVCRKYGIGIYGNYMLGIPGETPEEMFETAKLIRHNDANVKGIGYYNPSPGSDLFKYCTDNDLCLTPGDYIRTARPRIRGIDYRAAQRAMDYALGVSPLAGLLRRVAYIPLVRQIRNALKRFGPTERAMTRLREYIYYRRKRDGPG